MTVVQYHAYRLNPAGRIVSGDWIDAADDDAAKAVARELCADPT
ncbi:hypothetical protein [Phenylobacterium sp. J426]|nr:hypothetical protein [Phenylobacterium sp. J426]